MFSGSNQIDVQNQTPALLGLNLSLEFLQTLVVDIDGNDVRAVLGEAEGDFPADPLRGARDEGDFPL